MLASPPLHLMPAPQYVTLTISNINYCTSGANDRSAYLELAWSYADSQCHHLLLTRSADKLQLFIDGELVEDSSTTTSEPLAIDTSG